MNHIAMRQWKTSTTPGQIYIWSPGAMGLFPIRRDSITVALYSAKRRIANPDRWHSTEWEKTIFDMLMSGF